MNQIKNPKPKRFCVLFIIQVAMAIFAALFLFILPLPAPSSPLSLHDVQFIRIGTWNVHDCSASNKQTNQLFLLHSDIASAIAAAQIDAIALQEIQLEGRKNADIALLQKELSIHGWPMPYTATAASPQTDDLAILSRFPIIASEILLNPKNSPWPRAVLFARILVPEARTIDLYTAHFKAFDDERSIDTRKSQARALANIIRQRYGESIYEAPIVFAGDFNTIVPEDMNLRNGTLAYLLLRDNNDERDNFESINVTWLDGKPTFVSHQYASLTDHIILSPKLFQAVTPADIKMIESPKSAYGFPISDHHLLVISVPISVLPYQVTR